MNHSDLHAHVSLRPFAHYKAGYRTELASIRYRSEAFDNLGVAKYTQSDLTDLYTGRVKTVFAALYPFEQHWLRLVESLEDISDEIIAAYLRLPPEFFEQIQRDDYDYFRQLTEEWEFLKNEAGKQEQPLAEIPYTRQQLENLLARDDKIIIIPTIEGGHSLISGNERTVEEGLLDPASIKQNILQLKQLPVFFITLAHHFNNGFVQQAKSIYIPEAEKILSPITKPDRPITDLGYRIIDWLLSLSPDMRNTRRILIDIKHLGAKARKEFYQYAGENQNWQIPIVASHCAFSGLNTLEQLDAISEKGSRTGAFRAFEINLTAEDVWAIYRSKGIIGIMMDQGKLGGLRFWQWLFGGRLKWARLIANNILEMVRRAVDIYGAGADIWNIFAIGTDYDGVINPLNRYARADSMPLLAEDLTRVFERDPRFGRYGFGLTPQQAVKKIMYDNAAGFLRRNFTGVDTGTPDLLTVNDRA